MVACDLHIFYSRVMLLCTGYGTSTSLSAHDDKHTILVLNDACLRFVLLCTHGHEAISALASNELIPRFCKPLDSWDNTRTLWHTSSWSDGREAGGTRCVNIDSLGHSFHVMLVLVAQAGTAGRYAYAPSLVKGSERKVHRLQGAQSTFKYLR